MTRLGIVKTFVFVIVVAGLRPAQADMGNVQVSAVRTDSITVEWSRPSGLHGPGEAVGTWIVRWEVDGDEYYHYSERRSRTVNDTSFTITDLDPGVPYRIRVEGIAEKNVGGEWVNQKPRQVGIVTQRTRSPDRDAVLRVASTSAGAVEMELELTEPGLFDVIRFAYKERGFDDIDLNQTVREPADPIWTNNEQYGFEDRPSAERIVVRFSGLGAFRHYEIVAYGLNTGPYPGLKLDRATARTGGYRLRTTVEENVASDHEEVLDDYALELAGVTGGPILAQMVDDHPELEDTATLLAGDEQLDLGDDVAMLRWLIEQRHDLFETWQREELEDGQRTLADFMATDHPVLVGEIARELDVAPQRFQRGDTNVDSTINIADGQRVINFLFLGGPAPSCADAADVNDDGSVNIADAQYLLNFLFSGGATPKDPFGLCGVDPTADGIGCDEYWFCE